MQHKQQPDRRTWLLVLNEAFDLDTGIWIVQLIYGIVCFIARQMQRVD